MILLRRIELFVTFMVRIYEQGIPDFTKILGEGSYNRYIQIKKYKKKIQNGHQTLLLEIMLKY